MNVNLHLGSFLSVMNSPLAKLKLKTETHDYSKFVWGNDYVFEVTDSGKKGYMTAAGKGIKPDDYILLKIGADSYRFKVEEVDYYSDSSDTWIALLKQVLVN